MAAVRCVTQHGRFFALGKHRRVAVFHVRQSAFDVSEKRKTPGLDLTRRI